MSNETPAGYTLVVVEDGEHRAVPYYEAPASPSAGSSAPNGSQ